MREVTIDGQRYVLACDIGPIKIVVLERGFVYVGRVNEDCDPVIVIHGARSIIRWGTSQHLGELVNGPLPETKLGAICTVKFRVSQVIHMIEVQQDGWAHYVG